MVASVGGENPAAKKGGEDTQCATLASIIAQSVLFVKWGREISFLGGKNARERHPGRLFLIFCLPPRDHEAVEVHGGREGVQIYVFVLAVNACQLLLVDTEGSKPQAITG